MSEKELKKLVDLEKELRTGLEQIRSDRKKLNQTKAQLRANIIQIIRQPGDTDVRQAQLRFLNDAIKNIEIGKQELKAEKVKLKEKIRCQTKGN